MKKIRFMKIQSLWKLLWAEHFILIRRNQISAIYPEDKDDFIYKLYHAFEQSLNSTDKQEEVK